MLFRSGQNDSGQLGNFTRDASEYPGIVDEEYIALGNYDIVLDDEQDANGDFVNTITVPAAYMRSFSLGRQIDFEKTKKLVFESFNDNIASAQKVDGDLSDYDISYTKITPAHYGETKIIVRYIDEDNPENNKSAVANVTVLGHADDYRTAPHMGSGDEFTVALKADGTVWTWGKNTEGQLGQGGRTSDRNIIPTQVTFSGLASNAYITKIAVGKAHVVALDSDGNICTWGDNTYGQLGVDKTTTYSTKPVKAGVFDGINYLKNIEIADIFAGEYSSFIVTEGTSNITIAKKNDGSRVTVPLGINRNTFAFGNAAIDIDT